MYERKFYDCEETIQQFYTNLIQTHYLDHLTLFSWLNLRLEDLHIIEFNVFYNKFLTIIIWNNIEIDICQNLGPPLFLINICQTYVWNVQYLEVRVHFLSFSSKSGLLWKVYALKYYGCIQMAPNVNEPKQLLVDRPCLP